MLVHALCVVQAALYDILRSAGVCVIYVFIAVWIQLVSISKSYVASKFRLWPLSV